MSLAQCRVHLLMDDVDSDATEIDSDYASDDDVPEKTICPVRVLLDWSRWDLNPWPVAHKTTALTN